MSIIKQKKTNKLQETINSVLEQMSEVKAGSAEYAAMAKNLETLYSAQAKIKDCKISPDTIAVIAGNLLGIVLILGYEQKDIIRSKALGFVLKGRV
jgi:hypothetical protein